MDTFDHQDYEKYWYDHWVKKGCFKAQLSSKKKPYTIMMPPPNVTGSLHIGHVGPEAALGGPIALVEEGDTIEANLNTNELNCVELQDKETFLSREKKWKEEVEKNGGIHPFVGEVDTRLLARMRNLAVSAVYGAGMHPNGKVWVHNPRKSDHNAFKPKNKYL